MKKIVIVETPTRDRRIQFKPFKKAPSGKRAWVSQVEALMAPEVKADKSPRFPKRCSVVVAVGRGQKEGKVLKTVNGKVVIQTEDKKLITRLEAKVREV
jgi:hypothetical protein